MLSVGLTAGPGTPAALVLPVASGGLAGSMPADELRAEANALLAQLDDPGRPGALTILPRPLRTPQWLVLVGIGDGDEAGWRAAGAAIARADLHERSVTVAIGDGDDDLDPAAVRGVAEGLLLASYRFALVPKDAPTLAEVRLAVADPERFEDALTRARVAAELTALARDLTNMPSSRKNPEWFAGEVARAAAAYPGLSVSVREPDQLVAEGFGGILAVGGASVSGPRLVELSWRPAGARTHVVLVGKGITFDTGGVSIKPRDGMKLMRKDMGGAATVVAATLGAAALGLGVRVTALAPLAENAVGGGSYRPGDVIRHFGGITTVTSNTDAEGRLVVADAMAYAVAQLEPDLLLDFATLTGANSVALGKRTAALFTESDELATGLAEAAAAAGEQLWRLPLVDDYVEALGSDIADLHCSPTVGAGSIIGGLFLREFAGDLRDRWVHVDMSAPSWSDSADGVLVKGATGWGVRTLLRWLASVEAGLAPVPVIGNR